MKVKVDTSKINGFDALDENAKKALAGLEVEVPEPDYTGYVKKEVFDKKASEAADLSKQLKSKMTESELAEAENAKQLLDMKTELANLKKEKTISTYKAEYLGIGYDEQSAIDSATALAEGDVNKVFAIQKAFIENTKKDATAKALNAQPELTPGKPATKADAEQAEQAKIRDWFGL